jgi:hypothetical protein
MNADVTRMEPRVADEVKGTEVESRPPSPGVSRRRKRDESFRDSGWQVSAVAVLLAALLVLLFLSGNFGLVLGLVVAAAGAGKLVIKQLEAHENDELPPASREFRELADPRRPLTAADRISSAHETGTDTDGQ